MRDDAEAVRLEDHGRGTVADAGGEPVDPGVVRRGVGRSARRVLRAVAERQVVRDEHGHAALRGGSGDHVIDRRLDLGRRARGEPVRGRDRAQQLGVVPRLPGERLGGFEGRAPRVDVELGADEVAVRFVGGGRGRARAARRARPRVRQRRPVPRRAVADAREVWRVGGSCGSPGRRRPPGTVARGAALRERRLAGHPHPAWERSHSDHCGQDDSSGAGRQRWNRPARGGPGGGGSRVRRGRARVRSSHASRSARTSSCMTSLKISCRAPG